MDMAAPNGAFHNLLIAVPAAGLPHAASLRLLGQPSTTFRRMKRPITLTIAVVLQWIGAITTLIVGITLILGGGATLDNDLRAEIDKVLTAEGVTGVSASAITTGLLIGGVIVVAVAVFRVIVAFSLARGHNWARILITVFATLNLLAAIAQLISGQWINAIVAIIIEGLTLFLLWNASSSAYIKFKTAERVTAG